MDNEDLVAIRCCTPPQFGFDLICSPHISDFTNKYLGPLRGKAHYRSNSVREIIYFL